MAWELMLRGGYHHLPVVADDGTLLGLLDSELLAAHWHEGGPDQNREPVGCSVAAYASLWNLRRPSAP
jgi:hypothetical protein